MKVGNALSVEPTNRWIRHSAVVLTHKDEQGLVEVNPRLVAAELGAEVEQIERAIEYLTTPDPNSRSPNEEGRRMVREGQFTYRVVNHAKYRERGSDRTAYWREYRAKKRATVAQHPAQVAQPEITHAEAKSNAEAEEKSKSFPNSKSLDTPKSLGLGPLDPKTFSSLMDGLTKILQPKNQSHRTGIQARLQWAVSQGDDMTEQMIHKAGLAREQARPEKVINYWYKSMTDLGYTPSSLRAPCFEVLSGIRVSQEPAK